MSMFHFLIQKESPTALSKSSKYNKGKTSPSDSAGNGSVQFRIMDQILIISFWIDLN